jgi:hypothetical protein
MKSFSKYLLIWVSQNLAVPFWTVGHIHLMTTVYADITEVISSVGMNIIVILGIIIDYRDKRRDDSDKRVAKEEDDDIPICFI